MVLEVGYKEVTLGHTDRGGSASWTGRAMMSCAAEWSLKMRHPA